MQPAYDRAFQHITDIVFDKSIDREKLQAIYNQERLEWAKRGARFRPDFLTAQIPMPPEVSEIPATGKTSFVIDDTVIFGAISDGEDKKINYKRDREGAIKFVESEGGSNAQISIEAITGKSLESKGVSRIQEFFPFQLQRNDRLAVTVFKPVATQTTDVVTVCFAGITQLSQARVDEKLTPEVLRMLLAEIDLRSSPSMRHATSPVEFKGTGDVKKATTQTPKFDEPRLLTGIRTTFKHAMLNCYLKKQGEFAADPFPIWAIAAEAGNATENFRRLKEPLLLLPEEQLFFDLTNTIDGTTFADDGELEYEVPTL